ncbi:hypothetical protein CBF23_012960 [Marinomonas agarivorans]|nr:hypothetical protein CBF23_012960 [Marinomonas agarivorans]
MNWFYLIDSNKQKTLQYYDSYEQAYLTQFAMAHKIEQSEIYEIVPTKIPRLKAKDLSLLLLELTKGLEAGLKLHQVLSHLQQDSSHKKIRLTSLALGAALLQGTPFNHAFKAIVHQQLHLYCDLFVENITPEQLRHNLTHMHQQVTELNGWQVSLIKSVIYPAFIIQMAMLMWLVNGQMQTEVSTFSWQPTMYYIGVSLLELAGIYVLRSHLSIQLIETFSKSFRLHKLFSLLTASTRVGNPLQTSFTILPFHFSNQVIRRDLLVVYYKLRLGNHYMDSFPASWFPKESRLALDASIHTGDINRALTKASYLHEKQWQQQLNIAEKIAPIVALFVAGVFVSQTLIEIYRPLLELP